MGGKFGYITSADGAREKGARGLGTDKAYSVVEEVGAKYDEVVGLAKCSEYNGGGAFSEVGRVGDAIARELEPIGEDDGV